MSYARLPDPSRRGLLAVWLVAALLLLLTSCARTPHDAWRVQPDSLIRAAWVTADTCAPRRTIAGAAVPRRRVSDLRFYVVPDSAWGDPRNPIVGEHLGGSIYVARWLRRDEWIWAHEIVHAFGFHDHPDVPYETCRLKFYHHYDPEDYR